MRPQIYRIRWIDNLITAEHRYLVKKKITFLPHDCLKFTSTASLVFKYRLEYIEKSTINVFLLFSHSIPICVYAKYILNATILEG